MGLHKLRAEGAGCASNPDEFKPLLESLLVHIKNEDGGRGLQTVTAASCFSSFGVWRRNVAARGKGQMGDQPDAPPRFQLGEDVDYSGYLGPSYDQGKCGCCWLVACLSYLHALEAMRGVESNEAFSVQFMCDFCPYYRPADLAPRVAKVPLGQAIRAFFGLRAACQGGSPDACLNFLTQTGVPLAQDYDNGQFVGDRSTFTCQKKWKAGAWDTAASLHRLGSGFPLRQACCLNE